MGRLLILLPLAVILCVPDISRATEAAKAERSATTYFTDDPANWATPTTVLPPTYPQAALEKKLTATVDVMLSIKDTGLMDSVIAMHSEPKDAAFESAVQDALRYWRFAQSFDASCSPIATQSRLKVWFDIKEGQPSISVTHTPAPVAPGSVAIKLNNRDEVRSLFLEGTRRLARNGIDVSAEIHSKLTVEPQTGTTGSAEVVKLIGPPQLFQRPAGLASTAERQPSTVAVVVAAARAALMKARFEPGVVAGDAPIAVCIMIRYNKNTQGKL